MTHNWPHYDDNKGNRICTCAHMEAIIEYFKDKNNLTMALGAGDFEENYTRFEGYTFVVSGGYYEQNGVRLDSVFAQNIIEYCLKETTLEERFRLATSKLQEKLLSSPRRPILIPLSFNSEHFRNFLDKFANKFAKIIFDHFSSYYTRNWDKDETAKKIFMALEENGEFYSDTYFESAFSPLPDSEYIRLKDAQKIKLKNEGVGTIQKADEKIRLLDGSFMDVEKFYVHLENGKIVDLTSTLQMGPNSLCIKQEENIVRLASRDDIVNFILDKLKSIGFDVKYEDEKPYPISRPSGEGQVEQVLGCICAKKSAMGLLKASLTQLKDKLSKLSEKLGALKKN